MFLFFHFLGFNSTETKLQTPDGKIWKEEDFHHLSIKIYRDLSRQLAGKNFICIIPFAIFNLEL